MNMTINNKWKIEGFDGDRTWRTVEVVEITKEDFEEMLNDYEARGFEGGYLPIGRFVFREGNAWIGVDNADGDAWAEHFRHRTHAILHAAGLLPAPSTTEEEWERANGTGAWAM